MAHAINTKPHGTQQQTRHKPWWNSGTDGRTDGRTDGQTDRQTANVDHFIDAAVHNPRAASERHQTAETATTVITVTEDT